MESYRNSSTSLPIPYSKLVVLIFIRLGFVEVAAESMDDEEDESAS